MCNISHHFFLDQLWITFSKNEFNFFLPSLILQERRAHVKQLQGREEKEATGKIIIIRELSKYQEQIHMGREFQYIKQNIK